MTAKTTDHHSLRSLSSVRQSNRRCQQSLSPLQRHCHHFIALDPSYEPSTYDVIINPIMTGTTDRPNDYYDTYIRSVIPLYVKIVNQDRLDLQYTFLLSIIALVERDGGRFIRRIVKTDGVDSRSSSGWIHVSPMLAQIYTLYRLKCELKQMTLDGSWRIQEDDDEVEAFMASVKHQKELDQMKNDTISNDDDAITIDHDHRDMMNVLCLAAVTSKRDVV